MSIPEDGRKTILNEVSFARAYDALLVMLRSGEGLERYEAQFLNLERAIRAAYNLGPVKERAHDGNDFWIE